MLPFEDVGGAFEDGSEEFEILTSDEPVVEESTEEAQEPEGVQLTKEQYEELLKGKDSVNAMSQGLNKLAETLTPRAPINAPQRDDYDPAKLEEELWKPGKAAEVIRTISQRVAAQQSSQTALAAQDMEKKLLKLDPDTGETFKRYEQEIEKRVQGLPPQYRYQPNVYGQVYRVIVQERQEEIIQERAGKLTQAAVEQAVSEALAKAGVKVPKGPSMQTETMSAAPPKPKQRLVITSRDREDMMDSAMDPSDPEQVRAYLRWKQKKGIK